MKTIAVLVITNALTLFLLKQEKDWTDEIMSTEGVEELVCGDEHMVVLKDSEQAQIEEYEAYDPWDEDESIEDKSAND